MATRGNVYVRARLHVTALTSGTNEQKLEVAVGDGALSEYGQLLTQAEVRDLHRELGAWLDAVAQPEAASWAKPFDYSEGSELEEVATPPGSPRGDA